MGVKDRYLSTLGGWKQKAGDKIEEYFWLKQDDQPKQDTNNLVPPSEEGVPRFRYDKLPQNHIRYFKLVLNKESAPLCGRLMSAYNIDNLYDYSELKPSTLWNDESATLDIRKAMTGSSKYDALSYSWGSPDPLSWLYLSTVSDHYKPGKPEHQVLADHEPERNGWIPINAALRSFLLEARRRKLRRFMWIDAICINQDDIEEKGMQIPMMRNIYESAGIIKVWLGEGTEDERYAMGQLTSVTEKLLAIDEATKNRLNPLEEETFRQAGLPVPSDPFWFNIGQLMTRPYWARLWTLQEVAVNRTHTEIICGPQSYPLGAFEKFSTACGTRELRTWILTGKLGVMRLSLDCFDALAELHTCAESFVWGVRIDHLVPIILRRQATVSADKILGLLALVDHTTARQVAADISESAAAVFLNFARFYVQSGARESLLNHVATQTRLEGLPSWCPNFASAPQAVCLGTRWFGRAKVSTEHKKQMYRAGFQLKGKWEIPRRTAAGLKRTANLFSGKNPTTSLYDVDHPQKIKLIPDSNWLLTHGIHLDTISAVVDLSSEVASYNYMSTSSMQRFLEWDAECLEVARAHLPEGSEGYDMYARTLVANRIRLDLSLVGPTSAWDTGNIPMYDNDDSYDFITPYFAFKKYIQATTASQATSLESSSTSLMPPLDHDAKNYFQTVAQVTLNRRFFATKGGLIGLGPHDAQVGDKVVIIFFCPTPYVLRETTQSIRHRLVGECYLNGYMYGKALEKLERGELGQNSWILE